MRVIMKLGSKIGKFICSVGRKTRSGLNNLFIIMGYAVTFVVLIFFFRRGLPSIPTRVLILEHTSELWEGESYFEYWKQALYQGLTDPYLQRIVLHLDGDIGLADVQILRGLLKRLKAQGKEVICYAQAIGTLGEVGLAGYYLGSCAHRFYLGSYGHMMLEGINVERLYFGKFLKFFGIQSNFVAQGKYKSGPDEFTRSDMSLEERNMMGRILASWNRQILKDLTDDKRLDLSTLKFGLSGLTCSAQEAKKLKWVDALAQCWSQVKRRYSQDTESADANSYLKKRSNIWTWIRSKLAHRHHIGVLRIQGELGSSLSDTQQLCNQLIDMSENPAIKAVFIVLNTPGGTTTAAEALRYGVMCCRNAGKLTVIVMEQVAASGGYWIACGGDKIWAQPGTLTGSIGVYAGKFDIQEGLKKLGIGLGEVRLGGGSSESLYTTWNESQRRNWEKVIFFGYDDFISLVAKARGMTKKSVHTLAQGQVWTGEEAQALGLVDALGNLYDALEWAKQAHGSLRSLKCVDYTPGVRYSLRWIMSMLKEQAFKVCSTFYVQGQKLYMLMYP